MCRPASRSNSVVHIGRVPAHQYSPISPVYRASRSNSVVQLSSLIGYLGHAAWPCLIFVLKFHNKCLRYILFERELCFAIQIDWKELSGSKCILFGFIPQQNLYKNTNVKKWRVKNWDGEFFWSVRQSVQSSFLNLTVLLLNRIQIRNAEPDTQDSVWIRIKTLVESGMIGQI